MPFSIVEIMGTVEKVPQYIVEVQPLSKLCLGKITTHIWTVHDPLDLMIDFYNATKRTKAKKINNERATSNENKIIQFKQVIENITDQIISLEYLPRHTKVNIAVQFIHLTQEMLEWCRILAAPVLSYYNNIAVYFLNKTVFTPWGTVNITKSVLRGYFDAYGNIHLNQCLDIAFYCFFNIAIFDSYVQSNKYITDKRLIREVKRAMYRMTSYRKEWTNTLNTRVIDSVRGTVDMLNYHYKITYCSNWTKFLYLVASLICETNKKHNFSDKIIFIYNQLDYNIWESLLEQFHMNIIPELAISGHRKSCALFYEQLIKINPDACLNVLAEMFAIITEGSKHQLRRFKYCDKVYQKSMKYTLMLIWVLTPPHVKRDFIDKKHVFFYRCGQMFCYIDDYDFVMTFIKDDVLTVEERAVMIKYLVLCHHGLNEEGFIEENLVELRSDYNINEPDYNEEAMKGLILKCCNFTHIRILSEHVFTCNNDLDSFKTSISRDHKYLMDVINSFRGLPNAAYETNCFLQWCSVRNPTSFIKKYITRDMVMVKVYLNFLSEKRKPTKRIENEEPYKCYFDDLYNCSTLIFNNQKFFHEILETILSEGNPEDLTELLKLGSNGRMIAYLQTYLLSESGLKHILKIFVINRAQNLAFTLSKLLKVTAKHVSFKKHWLLNKSIDKKFGQYMLKNCKDVYQKYFKHLEKNDPSFGDSMWQFKTAVELVYKIFAHIVLEELNIAFIWEIIDLIAKVSNPSTALWRVNEKIKIASIT